jgi:hypothetical protein
VRDSPAHRVRGRSFVQSRRRLAPRGHEPERDGLRHDDSLPIGGAGKVDLSDCTYPTRQVARVFCTHCGKETRPRNAACTHCGFDLTHVIALLNEPDDPPDEPEQGIRSAREIATRALIVWTVAGCAAGRSKSNAVAWLKKERLWSCTTPLEKQFLVERASARRRIAFSWKLEALTPLLWATNRMEMLPSLSERCEAGLLEHAVVHPPHSTRQYIASSSLRRREDLLEEYEKVYEAHWKVRDARRRKKPAPKRIDPEVVYERHYGFNWVMGYMAQEWDDITTDT